MMKRKSFYCFGGIRVLFWIFAVFFSLGAGFVCFAEPVVVPDNINQAQKYYDKGKEYLDQGDFQKADDLFKQAELVLDPGQETSGSKNDLKQVAAAKVSGAQVQANAPAVKTEDKGQTTDITPDQAITQCQKSLKTDSRNRKVYYYNLGVLYAKKNDYVNAAKMFDRVVSLDRKDYDAYYNLAAIYETVFFNRKKAIEYYQMYLKFAPSGKEKESVANWLSYVKMQ